MRPESRHMLPPTTEALPEREESRTAAQRFAFQNGHVLIFAGYGKNNLRQENKVKTYTVLRSAFRSIPEIPQLYTAETNDHQVVGYTSIYAMIRLPQSNRRFRPSPGTFSKSCYSVKITTSLYSPQNPSAHCSIFALYRFVPVTTSILARSDTL